MSCSQKSFSEVVVRGWRTHALGPSGSFQNFSMVVGVGIGNAVHAVQQREFPEHAHEGPQRDAGISVFDAVQRTPADATGLRQVLCAQAAANARNAHALAQRLQLLEYFTWKLLY